MMSIIEETISNFTLGYYSRLCIEIQIFSYLYINIEQ